LFLFTSPARHDALNIATVICLLCGFERDSRRFLLPWGRGDRFFLPCRESWEEGLFLSVDARYGPFGTSLVRDS